MTRVRAWLQVNGGVALVLLAVGAIVLAILLQPPLPPAEPPYPPPTAAYGQPDTLLDGLEGRVYTTEQVLEEQHQWIVDLEARIEELERERR
jgi:hypothetical protein